MIKVRIDIKPSDGSAPFKRAHANIVNTGMGTMSQGDYYAHFYIDGKQVKSSHITDWPRQERTVWELLAAALAAPNLMEVYLALLDTAMYLKQELVERGDDA